MNIPIVTRPRATPPDRLSTGFRVAPALVDRAGVQLEIHPVSRESSLSTAPSAATGIALSFGETASRSTSRREEP